MENPEVIIYTDGGYRHKAGLGAWGCLIINPQKNKAVIRAEAVRETTNNRMELTAVVEALKVIKTPGKRIHLISDSKYTIMSCSTWIAGWKAKGWTKSTQGELKNVDILQQIDTLTALHQIDYSWVKGHSGDHGNEYVDLALNRAMDDLVNGGTGIIHGQLDPWIK